MYKWVRWLFIVFGVAVTYAMIMAASGGSQSTAIAIAGVVGVLLPFVLKLVPAAGHYMVGITLGASLLVALLAEAVSGEIVLSNLKSTDAATLLGLFLSVWGLSQIVYATLTQSPKTAGAVT